MMNYFKSVLAGCAASVLSGIIFILISFAISVSTEGSEDAFAEFSEVSVGFTAGPLLLIVLLAGFAVGFFWMLKRTSSPRLTP